MNRAAGSSPVAPSRAQLQAQAQKRRVILYASLAVIAVAILVSVVLAERTVPKSASDAPNLAKITVGHRAPEFSVSTTNGPFDLAQNGGKPTLLEVFATWCPHCQRETIVMDDLWKQYAGKVNIVGISGSPYGMDGRSPETQNDVVNFMTQFQVRYPISFDASLAVAHSYLQGGFPTIVLIDKNDIVQAIGDGEVPKADLVAGIDASLAGKHVDPKLGSKLASPPLKSQ